MCACQPDVDEQLNGGAWLKRVATDRDTPNTDRTDGAPTERTESAMPCHTAQSKRWLELPSGGGGSVGAKRVHDDNAT